MSRRTLMGSRILITGASQGIGRALAELAVGQGAWVLAAARSGDLLQDLAAKIPPRGGVLETVEADITNEADRAHIVEAAQERFGGLDVLVNNAGIGATGHFAEGDPGHLRAIMEVNFFGLAELTRACIPLLREGRHPAIVQGLSDALRAELAKDGIDVIVICPGLTQTNFSRNMLVQRARLKMDHLRGMTAEAVAAATLCALERGKKEIVLTDQGRLVVLLSRFFPRLTDRIAARRVRALFRTEIAARHQQPQDAVSV
jgi:short-subunit dehydrogenase